MTFLELAYETLKRVQVPLTAEEIWEKSKELGLDFETTGQTPEKTLGSKIYIDIRDNPESKFIKVGSHPSTFFITDEIAEQEMASSEAEIENSEQENGEYREKDLYPLLVCFLKGNPHFLCLTKTIDEKKSKIESEGFNEWLHPDMVGVPHKTYIEKTGDLPGKVNPDKYSIFAFEIKKKIELGNLRQSYFQAVSTSSWANDGYLVALEYDDSDPVFKKEMQRLTNSFGIGFIQLNAKDIAQSKILVPAKYREELDWTTINKLVEINPEVKEVIKNLNTDISARDAASKYDKVLSPADLQKHIEKKKICG